MTTDTLDGLPMTTDAAEISGYLVAPASYDGKMERARWWASCQREGRPAIVVTPRRRYAAVALDATTLAPAHAMATVTIRRANLAALGAARRHRSRATPGETLIQAERLPIPAACDLAAELARLLGEPGAIIERPHAPSPEPDRSRPRRPGPPLLTLFTPTTRQDTTDTKRHTPDITKITP